MLALLVVERSEQLGLGEVASSYRLAEKGLAGLRQLEELPTIGLLSAKVTSPW